MQFRDVIINPDKTLRYISKKRNEYKKNSSKRALFTKALTTAHGTLASELAGIKSTSIIHLRTGLKDEKKSRKTFVKRNSEHALKNPPE